MRPMEIAGMQLTHQKTPDANHPQITNGGVKLGFQNQTNNINSRGSNMSREPRFSQYKKWQKVTGNFLGPGSYYDETSYNSLNKQPTSIKMKRPMVSGNGPLSGSQGYVMQGDMIKLEPKFIEQAIQAQQQQFSGVFDIFQNQIAPQSAQAFTGLYMQMANKNKNKIKKKRKRRQQSITNKSYKTLQNYGQDNRKVSQSFQYHPKRRIDSDEQISFSYTPQVELATPQERNDSIKRIKVKSTINETVHTKNSLSYNQELKNYSKKSPVKSTKRQKSQQSSIKKSRKSVKTTALTTLEVPSDAHDFSFSNKNYDINRQRSSLVQNHTFTSNGPDEAANKISYKSLGINSNLSDLSINRGRPFFESVKHKQIKKHKFSEHIQQSSNGIQTSILTKEQIQHIKMLQQSQ